MRIIAVDDEELALSLLKDAICRALPDEVPMCFSTAEDALCYAEQTKIDVAFLDVEMAEMNGVELAKRLVKVRPTVNIIFVSGHDKYMDEAFQLHASGYVRKPVRYQHILKELSHLRYCPEKDSLPIQEIGPFQFDNKSLKVYKDGRDLLLVPREFALFRMLAGNPGIYFTPEDLYRQVWGQESNADVRTLYSHMSRLRKKLNLDGKEDLGLDIEQKRGKGYRLIVYTL